MSNLSNKVALITGAASGIGRESAIRMATDGASIMCADLDEAGAENTANIIIQQGGKAAAKRLDVSNEAAVLDSIKATADEFGGLNIIFNNVNKHTIYNML